MLRNSTGPCRTLYGRGLLCRGHRRCVGLPSARSTTAGRAEGSVERWMARNSGRDRPECRDRYDLVAAEIAAAAVRLRARLQISPRRYCLHRDHDGKRDVPGRLVAFDLESSWVLERWAPLLHYVRRFSLPTSRPEQAPLSLPGNDPLIQSIADRVRAVVERQPGRSLAALAGMLRVEYDVFRSLITEPERTVEPTFLIDVVAGLVRECAVDPQWCANPTCCHCRSPNHSATSR